MEMNESEISDRITDDVILWLENERKMTPKIPAIYFSLALMIIGLVGNGFVVYAYGFCFKRSRANVYTHWLAICDICCCVFNIPFEVFQIRYPLMYGEAISCKLFRTSALVLYSWQGLMLLCISFDRYAKICKPMKHLIRKSPEMHVVYAILMAMIFSWPNVLLNGNSTSTTGYSSVHGITCSTPDFLKTTEYVVLFKGQFLFLATSGFFILLFFYGNILIEVRKWKMSNIKQVSGMHRSVSGSSILSDMSVSYSPSIDVDRICVIGTPEFVRGDSLQSSKNSRSETVSFQTDYKIPMDIQDNNSLSDTDDKQTTMQVHSRLRHQARLAKTTFIFITVTVTFVLSYLPYLTLSLFMTTNILVFDDQNDSIKSLVSVGVKMYCINNASNPIIYSIFNRDFRQVCKALFSPTESKNIKTCKRGSQETRITRL